MTMVPGHGWVPSSWTVPIPRRLAGFYAALLGWPETGIKVHYDGHWVAAGQSGWWPGIDFQQADDYQAADLAGPGPGRRCSTST